MDPRLLHPILSGSGGGYTPPPDYSAIWTMFLGFAFACILAILTAPDLRRNAQYVLGGLGILFLLAALFTPNMMEEIPNLEVPLRDLAHSPFTWLALVILIIEVILLSPQVVRWRRPRIDVVAPLANSAVPLKTVVYGMVHPPHYPVRVMIFSGDLRYHRQDVHTIYSSDGTRWSVECAFGLPGSASGMEYEIAAIDGKIEIDAVCATLPAGIVKALPVKVRRS